MCVCVHKHGSPRPEALAVGFVMLEAWLELWQLALRWQLALLEAWLEQAAEQEHA